VTSVYSGKFKEGVGYIQQSIIATEHADQNEVSLNERKLYLAQARSRLYPGEQAVAEARLCHDETSSLEAEYWFAQCLRNNGQLQDALAVLMNIINTYPISYPQQFEETKFDLWQPSTPQRFWSILRMMKVKCKQGILSTIK
jgi:hypothetical protein